MKAGDEYETREFQGKLTGFGFGMLKMRANVKNKTCRKTYFQNQ